MRRPVEIKATSGGHSAPVNALDTPASDTTPVVEDPSRDSRSGRTAFTEPIASERLAEQLGIGLRPSDLVSVDYQALSRMARHVFGRPDLTSRRPSKWDDPTYWLVEGTPRERSQYFAVGTAINFRFWRVRSRHVVTVGGILDGRKFTGAMYMWRCLRLAWDSGRLPVFDAEFLAGMTVADYDVIFADDTGHNPLDLAANERLRNLRDLGRNLVKSWDGYFWNVVQASDGDLVSFCNLSRQFRAFDDPLAKLTMLNVILHTGSGLTSFDADPLPAIDYHLVKQLLRHGILAPAPNVRDKLVGQHRLTPVEASELRRLALIAFLEIGRQTGLPGHILDNLWWGNRQVCSEEAPACTDQATAANCPFLTTCAQVTDFGMPLERTRYY